MGDIIHTLPAAATLKHSFSYLAWVVDPKWAPLLEGNPFLDEIICLDRRKMSNILAARRRLRELEFDLAVDFQGLIKSAMVASLARPDRIYGYHQSQAREPLAALSHKSASAALSETRACQSAISFAASRSADALVVFVFCRI